MKVYIVKHYWKNGENATWESHAKVDKKVFEHLKKNYHNFVKDRPFMIKEGKYYIYFCYEDSVDIYGRKITNVTFFVSEYKVNEQLCSKDYQDLELSLFNLKFFLKWLLIVIGLIICGKFILDIQKSPTNDNTPPKSRIKSDKKVKIINDINEISNKETKNPEKEKLNKYVEKELEDVALSSVKKNIKTKKEFDYISEKLGTIKIKIKGQENLLNNDNGNRISKLNSLYHIYKNLLENGLEYKLDILKDTQKIKSIKLFFNKKKISKIQPNKIYKIDTKIKNNSFISFFSKDKEIKKEFKINENELIELFNGKPKMINIDKNYFLKLTKIKGENNESKTKE